MEALIKENEIRAPPAVPIRQEATPPLKERQKAPTPNPKPAAVGPARPPRRK